MIETLLEFLFWASFLGLAHSYLIYPTIMRWLAQGKRENTTVYTSEAEYPPVSLIMSLYNEEQVIQEKLESIAALDYPPERLSVWIGSDCSSDQTNAIVSNFTEGRIGWHFFPFVQRRGKPPVINELVDKAFEKQAQSADHLLLITDASVLLGTNTLKALVKHFKNEKIAIVDAHMVHTGMKKEGISKAEDTYISSEVLLKYRESITWGKMIGPFGGCYAIRSNYFSKVPANFLVDDFYIAMRVLEAGGQAINALDAECYEAVSHEISEEYRRKRRISSGNFQNLFTFRHLWWPPFQPLSFAFFSHKILRWLGPFFLILLFLTAGLLALKGGNLFYLVLFIVITLFLIGTPILDRILRGFSINILPLRGAHYFVLMNMALLEGFFNFLKGIKSNVWEPTKRN